MTPTSKTIRALVIDDDPTFSAVLGALGPRWNVDVTCYKSAAELEARPPDGPFDIAVVDYYLGDQLGTQIVPLIGDATPIILVSQTGGWIRDVDLWPASIEKFVHKKGGPEAILDEVIATMSVDRRRFHSDRQAGKKDKPYF